MIKKYIKKPFPIEAVQFTGQNESEVSEFAYGKIWVNVLVKQPRFGETYNPVKYYEYFVDTPEGNMGFTEGDYIIKDENGIFRPIPKDIFEEMYEEAFVLDKENAPVMDEYFKSEWNDYFKEEK